MKNFVRIGALVLAALLLLTLAATGFTAMVG